MPTLELSIGDWVQSRYSSPWKGIIENIDTIPDCFLIRQLISKNGDEIRLKKAVVLNKFWLQLYTPSETDWVIAKRYYIPREVFNGKSSR